MVVPILALRNYFCLKEPEMSTPTTMKAVRIHSYGEIDTLVYEDAPLPQIDADSLLLRIHAAGVNPVDWKTRRGRGVADERLRFPLILGWDVSGTVAALGANVRGLAAGDEVYGMIGFPELGSAYAEYASALPAHLARKPASLDHTAAAGVPLAALTAWQALFDAAQLRAGQTVLVHAAAGGVGHLAVQLARWRGARVIGTASTRNAGLLRELGVDQIIDYTAGPFEDAVDPVDLVLDTVGGETLERSFAAVRPGGQLISIVAEPSAEQARERGIRARRILVEPNAAQLAEIAGLIDAGVVRPLVETVLPLAEARAAHELSESGRTRGKIVLQVRG
jgi:NADPH:quinone reductase-like Zn-dependent oxidoreductase